MGASWDAGTLDTTARGSAILHEDPVVLLAGTRHAVIDKLEMDAHFESCLWKEKRRLKAPPAFGWDMTDGEMVRIVGEREQCLLYHSTRGLLGCC